MLGQQGGARRVRRLAHRSVTSLKWTSCIPTSSIMAASSSMFGVMTRKAEQPCRNIPEHTDTEAAWVSSFRLCAFFSSKTNIWKAKFYIQAGLMDDLKCANPIVTSTIILLREMLTLTKCLNAFVLKDSYGEKTTTTPSSQLPLLNKILLKYKSQWEQRKQRALKGG